MMALLKSDQNHIVTWYNSLRVPNICFVDEDHDDGIATGSIWHLSGTVLTSKLLIVEAIISNTFSMTQMFYQQEMISNINQNIMSINFEPIARIQHTTLCDIS